MSKILVYIHAHFAIRAQRYLPTDAQPFAQKICHLESQRR